jgi:TetR/AcrR family transcriptional regulator, transcriptional repressor for nem operon
LLWERGYAATSPSDILRESRSGQGSLYHFFEGKEDLATQALREVEVEASARIEATCAPGTGAGKERVGRYLLAERDALRGCRLGRLAQEPELPESLRRTVASGFERVHAVLREAIFDAQSKGSLPASVDSELLADTVMAVVQGGYVLARAYDDPGRMKQAVAGLGVLLGLSRAPSDEGIPGQSASRKRAAPSKERKSSHASAKSRVRKAT